MDPTRRLLLLLPLLIAASPAIAAGDPRLELELDSAELVVGQTVTARIRLIDGVMRGGRPDLLVGEGLAARFSGQSQQHLMVNFQATRIVDYSFALTARAEGTWNVGPVEVVIGDRTLRAEARTVKVSAPTAAPSGSSEVEAELSRTDPFLGEVLTYTFRFRTAERVLDIEWTPPDFDGYTIEKSAEAARKEYRLDQGDTTYQVQEIVLPLIAAAEGERTIPATLLTARLPARTQDRRSPFLGSVETRTLSSAPIKTRIRPLPIKERPADFSGLVGRFNLQATLKGPSGQLPTGDIPRVAQGESLTLELTLSGDGTLTGARLPPAPDSESFRAYDDSPEVSARLVDGRLQSVARFRRAIVPAREGLLELPPVVLSVFDPIAERYVQLQSEALRIEVGPGSSGQVASFARPEDGAADAREDIAALGEDILPVPGSARIRDRSLRAALPWALIPPLLPALGLLAMAAEGLLKRRQSDPRATLRASLRALPQEAGPRLAALEQTFREACGLRLGRPAPGLDPQAVSPLGPEALAIYEDLSRARYGGFQPGGDLEARVRAFVEAA